MQISQKQRAVDELLSEFDSEMNRLRHKFHAVLKKYEEHRVEHLKNIISNIQSL